MGAGSTPLSPTGGSLQIVGAALLLIVAPFVYRDARRRGTSPAGAYLTAGSGLVAGFNAANSFGAPIPVLVVIVVNVAWLVAAAWLFVVVLRDANARRRSATGVPNSPPPS